MAEHRWIIERDYQELNQELALRHTARSGVPEPDRVVR
jgi:SRSO17 transposase